MSLSTLMVHVEPKPPLDGRVHFAISLAQRFGCQLIGISAAVLPPYPSEGAYFVNQEFVETERRDIVEVLHQTGIAFREAAGTNMKAEWRSALDLPENYVVSEARATDLLIVGRGNGDVCRSVNPGNIVLKAGRPLLVVPPAVASLKGERIVVGWKECREARRALYDALPVLRHAKSVMIAEICDEAASSRERGHLADCCEYLRRNGISAVCTELCPDNGSVAQQLIGIATAEHADLIVTGAYGHSRLGEWIFGGVTREMLTTSPVCCFMSN